MVGEAAAQTPQRGDGREEVAQSEGAQDEDAGRRNGLHHRLLAGRSASADGARAARSASRVVERPSR